MEKQGKVLGIGWKIFLYRVWMTKMVKYQTKKIDGAKSYQDVADSFGFDVYTFKN